MIVDITQRWRDRRSVYRPVGELLRLDPRQHEVAAIDGPGSDNIARAFVERHHYSGSMGAARERIGLYRGEAVNDAPADEEVQTTIDRVLPPTMVGA